MSQNGLTINIIEHNFESAVEVIRNGNVYVSRFPDGDCVLFNNRGSAKALKSIMYNPNSRVVRIVELHWHEFETIFAAIVMPRSHQHYEVVENGDNIITYYESISKALMALETGSYKDYRVR